MPNPCSTLGCYILALNPSTVSEETASVERPFQATIVLGKNDFFFFFFFICKRADCLSFYRFASLLKDRLKLLKSLFS